MGTYVRRNRRAYSEQEVTTAATGLRGTVIIARNATLGYFIV